MNIARELRQLIDNEGRAEVAATDERVGSLHARDCRL
jgi:hypothetical protein